MADLVLTATVSRLTALARGLKAMFDNDPSRPENLSSDEDIIWFQFSRGASLEEAVQAVLDFNASVRRREVW